MTAGDAWDEPLDVIWRIGLVSFALWVGLAVWQRLTGGET